jgi:Tfp pilus assembly PilM family ATPase
MLHSHGGIIVLELSAKKGRRSSLFSGGRAAKRSIGVEADGSLMRIARQETRGKDETWSLATLRLDVGAKPSKSPRASLRKAARAAGVPRGHVVCALSSPMVEIFPLDLPSTDGDALDALVVENARKHLSYPIEQAVLDYSVMSDHVRRPGEDKTAVLVFSALREIVDRSLKGLEEIGLNATRIVTPACALAPRIVSGAPESRNTIINTAEESTSVSVVQNGEVLLERILSWGTESLSKRLQADLNLDEEKCWRLLNQEESCPESAGPPGGSQDETLNPYTGVFGDVMAPAFQELASAASSCIGYCNSVLRHEAISSILLLGSMASNRALRRFLEQELELTIRDVEYGMNLSGLEKGIDAASYATAACCALWPEDESP